MKLKSFLLSAGLALAFAAAPVFAASATFLVTFDPPADAGPEVEYVVEAKQPDGTWVEVAKGDGFATGEAVGTLGIKYSANVAFGTYTVRVFTRVKDGTIPREVETDTSNQASTMVRPGKPNNAGVFSNRQ